MKKIFTLIALCFAFAAKSQTLSPGDIAFLAIQTDGNDAFAWVALSNIPGNAKIIFTDRGIDSLGAFRSTEDTMSYTAPAAGITAGTVVRMRDSSGICLITGPGTAVGSLGGLSTNGEQVFAIQGSIANPSFIAVISTNPFITSGTATSNTSYLPSALTAGLHNPYFTVKRKNGFYNIVNNTGTKTTLLPTLADTTNYTRGDSLALTGITAWPNWVFNVSGVTPPPASGIPSYTIGQVTTDDANGVADSLNVVCKLTGTVVGINYATTGLSFTIVDATGGINVFKSANVTPAYTVTEGDQIRVIGQITQFRGLTEIVPDSIVFISAGNPLPTPTVVTTIQEVNESRLVRANGFYLVNAAQWPAAGADANVQITNGTDTILMRIDKETNIDGTPAPTGNFDVIGIGSQFDATSPYTSGYQLFPRYLTDIIVAGSANALSFNATTYNIGENAGSINVTVSVPTAQATAQTAYIFVQNGNGFPVYGTHYTTTPAVVTDTIVLNIPANATSASFAFNAIDNAVANPNRVVAFSIARVTSGITVGARANATVTIIDNDTTSSTPSSIPTYPIGTVNRPNTTTGISDSVGVYCKVVGTVLGINYATTGLSFTLVDATGGINVFKAANVTPAYNVTEGDQLRVIGRIAQFRGLTEIIPDSLVLLSSNNPPTTPTVVTALSEATESRLVRFNNMRIVNPSVWPVAGRDANVQITNGVDTILMRIDKETNIDGTPVPVTLFQVTGIGGQFDTSAPYLDGYQLFPRYMTDLVALQAPSAAYSSATRSVAENIGTTSLPITISSALLTREDLTIAISAVSGSPVYGTHYTTTPAAVNDTIRLRMNAGATTAAVTVNVIDNTTFGPNRVIRFDLVGTAGLASPAANQFTLTILENDPNSAKELNNQVSMYPNPSNGMVTIAGIEGMSRIRIQNANGQLVYNGTYFQGETLSTEGWAAGIYFVEVVNNGTTYMKKLMVK